MFRETMIGALTLPQQSGARRGIRETLSACAPIAGVFR
ncbi:hypothetical protein B005_2091 [Nocardiopsis alba ATCC BAA-2165]|uniref:Uncharacterized protein n=1 Tax=Nocardiopsis alba (strain ATCC BAA-2165 / BE74) TaxID=1205910 RepID=J7LEH1_NOCAA|nr:hypothetical protein B005_2091 [Nocardiopsis alba ATCC BAA-2165]